jgi:hypothetical protein
MTKEERRKQLTDAILADVPANRLQLATALVEEMWAMRDDFESIAVSLEKIVEHQEKQEEWFNREQNKP